MKFVSSIPNQERNTRGAKYDDALAATVRSGKGRWGIVAQDIKSRTDAHAKATYLRTKRHDVFPSDEFEIAARFSDSTGWTVYARTIRKA